MIHPDFELSIQERRKTAAFARHVNHLAAQSICGVLNVDTGLSMRGLYESEIKTLLACRCRSQDWTKHRLVIPTEQHRLDLSSVLQRLVTDTALEDTVVLIWQGESSSPPPQQQQPLNISSLKNGLSEKKKPWWEKLPPGLHGNLMVSNTIVYLNARVHRNTCIENSFIAPEALILNCGSITCDNNFAELMNQHSITVGAESGGGRTLTLSLESTMLDVTSQLTNKHRQDGVPDNSIFPTMNVFDRHVIVRETPTIRSVYLHHHASIEGASEVEKAVLMSGASIESNSTARNVLMQWNTSISGSSSITDALLMEEAHAGPHSFVVSSILGPDVHVSAGEIHASILGPNTNAHHQSLVIGVLWPLGRGNVGYGANVGSNHTGRIPDQECAAGEGTFWGLSSVIKFPVDLSQAPYTIVAAGTSLPPQQITMPFSLIVSSSSSSSHGSNVNDIIPGWLLKSSPYTLARSEKKYANRRKADRHQSYTGWKIIRADTVAMCCRARKELQTSGKTAGIGACYLSERAREAGIVAYTDCIQRFALHGLLKFVLANGGRSMDMSIVSKILANAANVFDDTPTRKVEWPRFPWDHHAEDSASEWEFQQMLLMQEFPLESGVTSKDWLQEQLRRLITLENAYTERIFRSKSRDDSRGSQTIPGYADCHVSADQDPVIIEARKEAQQLEESVQSALKDMDHTSKL